MYSAASDECIAPMPSTAVYLTTENAQTTYATNNGLSSLQNRLFECGAAGQVTNSLETCTNPLPDTTSYATMSALNAVKSELNETEIALIDIAQQLGNNVSTGAHVFCHLCPAGTYLTAQCTAVGQTECTPCPANTFSDGGFNTVCTPCAELKSNCLEATCAAASGSNAMCTVCDLVIVGDQALVLSDGNCMACPEYTYRSNRTQCTLCPVDDLTNCAFADCLPTYTGNTGVDENTPLPLSTIVAVTQDSYFDVEEYPPADFIDTVTNFIHSEGGTSNPWVQVEYVQPVVLVSFILKNRGGYNSRIWLGDATGNGFIVRVSDTTCAGEICPGTVCYKHLQPTNPGFAGNALQITCDSPTVGKYMSIQLPGNTRTLNLDGISNLIQSTSPYSFAPPTCSEQCELGVGCAYGVCTHDRRPVDSGPYPCQATGCYPANTAENAWPTTLTQGFVAASESCQTCDPDTEFLNDAGVCTTCPCSGPCQAGATQLTLTNAAQSSTYGSSYSAGKGIDGNVGSFTHTANSGTTNPWWQAQISGGPQQVSGLNIVNRVGICGNRWWAGNNCIELTPNVYDGPNQGFVIKVANESCAGVSCPGVECFYGTTYSGDYADPIILDIVCPPGIVGSYVNFLLVGNPRSLQIGEVKAYTLPSESMCAQG